MTCKLGSVLPALLLVALTGCGELGVIPTDPNNFVVKPDALGHLRKPQTIALKNSYQTETKAIVWKTPHNHWAADLKQLTDTTIVMLSRGMEKQDIAVAPHAAKSITLSVQKVRAGGGAPWQGVGAILDLEAQYGDGTKTLIEGLNPNYSQMGLARAVEAAMFSALTDLLREDGFVAYMNR